MFLEKETRHLYKRLAKEKISIYVFILMIKYHGEYAIEKDHSIVYPNRPGL